MAALSRLAGTGAGAAGAGRAGSGIVGISGIAGGSGGREAAAAAAEAGNTIGGATTLIADANGGTDGGRAFGLNTAAAM